MPEAFWKSQQACQIGSAETFLCWQELQTKTERGIKKLKSHWLRPMPHQRQCQCLIWNLKAAWVFSQMIKRRVTASSNNNEQKAVKPKRKIESNQIPIARFCPRQLMQWQHWWTSWTFSMQCQSVRMQTRHSNTSKHEHWKLHANEQATFEKQCCSLLFKQAVFFRKMVNLSATLAPTTFVENEKSLTGSTTVLPALQFPKKFTVQLGCLACFAITHRLLKALFSMSVMRWPQFSMLWTSKNQ